VARRGGLADALVSCVGTAFPLATPTSWPKDCAPSAWANASGSSTTPSPATPDMWSALTSPISRLTAS